MGTVYNPNRGQSYGVTDYVRAFARQAYRNPVGALYAGARLYNQGSKAYNSANKFFQSNNIKKSTKAQSFNTNAKRFVNPNTRTGGWPSQPCQLEKELKYVDWESQEHDVTDTPGLVLGNLATVANGVPIGTGESERVGRHICMYSLDVQWNVHIHDNVHTAFLAGRMYNPVLHILTVLDSQSNGTGPAANDVISTGGVLIKYPKVNLSNDSRLKILKWKRINLQMATFKDGTNYNSQYVGKSPTSGHFRVPLKIPVTFTGDTATIGSIADNSIHFITFLTSFTADVQQRISVSTRLRYFDV